MLVLSRRRNQAIMIGDDVEVVVVDVRGDKVRLGIRAPENIPVHRREVFDQMNADKQHAIESGMEKSPIDPFLRAAIDEAKQGLAEGGIPIGSVLVRGGEIIARGHNRRVQNGDPMAHAEIDCLKNAGRQKTYKDTVLYSTLMPCYLCSGASVQFGVPKVIVGESVNYPGEDQSGASPEFLKSHGVEVIDLHDGECIEMMSRFIREHPEVWNEDIGVD